MPEIGDKRSTVGKHEKWRERTHLQKWRKMNADMGNCSKRVSEVGEIAL